MEQQADFAKMIERKFQEALRLTENSIMETKDQIENMCRGNLRNHNARSETGGTSDVSSGNRYHEDEIKAELPEFNDKLNLEQFLESINAVERVFEYKN